MGIPFDEKELQVVEIEPASRKTPVDFEHYAYPVTEREATLAAYAGKPVWLLTGKEIQKFNPRVIPDCVARGMVIDAEPFKLNDKDVNKDMFGLDWVYEASIFGSMEVPGQFLFDDVNDWKEKVVFPDVDSWDWEGAAAFNKDFFNPNKFVQAWFFTGWFERLISFMGFEDAAVALLDEDQEDAVSELMMALSDLYIDIIDHYVKYFPQVDCFYIHDDWGSQASSFFNADVAERLLVPAIRKVTDHIHELGLIAELHCCGNAGVVQTENMIKAGWDSWSPQSMNPSHELWEKYGDQIILAPELDRVTAEWSEEDQIEAGKKWVERFCTTPGKMPYISMYDIKNLQPAYRRTLYVESRKAFAQWPED